MTKEAARTQAEEAATRAQGKGVRAQIKSGEAEGGGVRRNYTKGYGWADEEGHHALTAQGTVLVPRIVA